MLNPVTISLMNELQEKVEGLSHCSDSFFPYNVSGVGKGLNFIEIIKEGENDKSVRELTPETFFSKIIKSHSSHREEEYRNYRYQDLEGFYRLKFSEIRIIKIGELYVDVHLIGKTEEGDLVILSTNELHFPMHVEFDY